MDKEYLENLVGAEAAAEIWQKHRSELAELVLRDAVKRSGGRNEKAIRALLDESALLESQDMAAAAESAIAELKSQNGWLFAPPQVSSPGTGALTVSCTPSLEDVGKMSMAEYRRYRQSR